MANVDKVLFFPINSIVFNIETILLQIDAHGFKKIDFIRIFDLGFESYRQTPIVCITQKNICFTVWISYGA